MKKKTIVYQFSDETINKMKEYFLDKQREKTPPYALFQADEADTVITAYDSKKVVFQGISADIDAQMWNEFEKNLTGKNAKKIEKKEKEKIVKNEGDYHFLATIGSDEVGTGDFFGPIIVTAAFVSLKDITFLEDLKIKDSKKITDEQIKKIAPLLIKRIPHYSVILRNKEYNEKYSQDMNMNKIKALLHNQALFNLLKKDKYNYQKIIMDQFVNEKKYYEYLNDKNEVVKNITFLTKAEDKCLSVAVASIISRFIFLKEFKDLEKELGLEIPKGAGTLVDEAAIKIVKLKGLKSLDNIAKLNFKNLDKIKKGI